MQWFRILINAASVDSVAECITDGAFQCFESSEQQVTFRGRLHGISKVTSSLLVACLETYFAEEDSTVAVQGVHLDVDKRGSYKQWTRGPGTGDPGTRGPEDPSTYSL